MTYRDFGTICFLGLLFLLNIALKLTGQSTMSWLMVFSFIWFLMAYVFAYAALIYLLRTFETLISKKEGK